MKRAEVIQRFNIMGPYRDGMYGMVIKLTDIQYPEKVYGENKDYWIFGEGTLEDWEIGQLLGGN